MSAYSVLNELAIAGLVVRWTILLALAWFGHRMLAGRNPRWRVALWRAATVGVAVVGALTLAPPVLTVPVVPAAMAVVVSSDMAHRSQEPGPEWIAPISRPEDSGPTATAVPSTARRPEGASWRIVPVLVGLWAVGVAVLAGRLVLAWFGLGRIIRRSAEAPGRVVGLCREVAEAIGAPDVRVACSAAMASPCLAGFRRPVLLLPARALADDDLRAILAHELAHARGHDLAWNLVAHVATIVLWFHPMAWRVRSAHASACDAVCDAVAADFLGDVPTYARTLARVALDALTPPPEPGLAMARSSEIRRRVDALNRTVFRSPLPRRLALPAVLGGAVLSILIGGIAVSSSGPAANAEAPTDAASDEPAAKDRIEIQAVAAATGKPIEGVTVSWGLRINNGRYQWTRNSTGADGRAVLEWPRGATFDSLDVWAQKAGFAAYLISWDNSAHMFRLPAVKVLRFVPGVAIGGVVKDETGKPVAGAKITVNASPTESEGSPHNLSLADIATDAQGRWRVDDAPTDLAGVIVSVQAARFLRVDGPPSRNLDAVSVLKRGFTVKGRVLDTQGKPVAGANVRGGGWSNSVPTTKTDARGEFVLENCPPGASIVTVRADGLAPDLRDIHSEDQPSLEFRLGPGHTVRGKVVDRQGNPVAGAMAAADTWRGHRSLDFRVDTDKDGRFEWRGAPADAVLFDFFKIGYMPRRLVSLTPDDAGQVVTLAPELVISGQVTDAETGRPVPTFRLVRGLMFPNNPRVTWTVQDAAQFTGGRYTIKHVEPYEGYAVRIEADGYKPADSRLFQPGEVSPTFDFTLTRAGAADLLTGVVLGLDGQPAAGVEVALATPEHPLVFDSAPFRFGRGNGMSFAKTGADGRFSFARPGGSYRLAAMSDHGFAESALDEPGKSGTLALKAWGKITGVAKIGRQPAANQTISVARRDDRPRSVHEFYSISARTDAQGRFAFDRVIPCTSEVSRVVVTEFGNGFAQHMGCWQEPVDIEPGQVALVRIGGKGRPVIGRVALKAAPAVHVDWRQNRPARIAKPQVVAPPQGLRVPDPRRNAHFAANFEKDGRFRVEDVPPGHYDLTFTIDAPPDLDNPGLAKVLGQVTVPVEVPEGDADVPVDLGEIPAEVQGR
jgi:beta-lactamase regulating signal transducer with metallopeptidase domain